jgi:glucose-6-phosphate dehydrogenase assembly protein OpcA
MKYNSYRTRYVGEALRSVDQNRVKYTENMDATEVLYQGFVCSTS